MFNCPSCQQTATKPKRVVTKVQVVNHRAERFNKKTKEARMVVVGRGPQIREEVSVCGACSETYGPPVELTPESEETVEPREREDRTDYAAIADQFEEEEAT